MMELKGNRRDGKDGLHVLVPLEKQGARHL